MNTALAAVPDLAGDYALSVPTIERFRSQGHAVLRGCAGREDVLAYRDYIAGVVERLKYEARGGVYNTKLEERDTYHKAFVQLENLWTQDEGVKRFTFARRLAKIAAELLGVDGVRLYHDQALFKEAGGGHTPWHQDQYYWPIDNPNTVTMWMALDDCPIEMGSLVFADESHTAGSLASLAISDESERVFRDEVIRRGLPLSINEMNAGDATWHYGWTLHKAPGNITNRERRAMTIIYVADGARVSEFKTDRHPREASRWLPGLQPGDLVDSALNPVLYSK
ncbi:MAG: phytanoyl-CoA dioxygenase family protein [Candidatus Hydrogenedentes bacterium]|nr:phytanoyl-CoA dioxygenase family protein [Candidatus Hydrogenedentota bacterium]